MQLCYTPDVISAKCVMKKLQTLIVVCTILLVGYFTWDTMAQLDSIDSLKCAGRDKYDKYFPGAYSTCILSDDNSSGRKSLAEIFDSGYSKEEVIKIKKDLSNSALRRGIFLDSVILFTGSFTFITVSKLQSKKGGVYEAKSKNKVKA